MLKYNRDYFETIDSEDKAYWLGFLYADGCVYKTKNRGYYLQLVLKAEDKSHLEKFKQSLESEHKISKITGKSKNIVWECCRIVIGSKKIVQDLIKLGCDFRKTFKINNIPNIPKRFYRHFIRGYFDGDGSVFFNKYGKVIITFTGNRQFIEDIKKSIENNSRIKINKHKSKIYMKNNKGTVFITYYNNTAKNILKYMYDNANIYLDRKYKKYKSEI